MPGQKFLTKKDSARLILPNANSTDDSFTVKSPTQTEPAPNDNGIFEFKQDTNVIELSFFGTNADAETFDVRIYGWRKCIDSGLWIPHLLAELACTLDAVQSAAAVDGLIPTASDYICDTIAKTSGADSVSVLSGTAGEMASARLDVYGMHFIEIEFDRGTAASANGWISTL